MKKTSAQLDREIAEALAGSGGSSSPFEEAKAEAARLDAEAEAAGQILRTFPRGPTGLTPDAVKATPEYRAANARFQKAFARQRDFNGVFVKRFAKELRAERAERDRRRTGAARSHATIVKGEKGDRVLADLTSWGVDRQQVDEVRQAFRVGDHRRAMALARDLGWNRASKRGRS